jgi:hypothetical protein
MGLFSGIKNAFKSIGKIAGKVGDIAGKVGGIASKIANIGNKAINLIKAPLETLTNPIKKLAGGFLDKLPFGLGKMIKPFADKFIDGAGSFLQKNVLGGLGILTKATKTAGDIANIAETVKGVADKVGAFSTSAAQFNIQNLFAHAHASKVE